MAQYPAIAGMETDPVSILCSDDCRHQIHSVCHHLLRVKFLYVYSIEVNTVKWKDDGISVSCFTVSSLPEFAMSPNNNEVHIYSKKGPKWEVESVLTEVGTPLALM